MALTQFLELRTLLVTNIISMLICFVVITIVWWHNKARFPATAHWLLCLCCQVASFQMILLRGTVSDTWSIIVPAWLISSGFIQLLQGLSLHLARPRSFRHDYILQAVFLLIQAYFTYLNPNLLWRSVNYSVFLAWLSIECVWMIHQTPAKRRFGADFLGCVMAAYALIFSGRVVFYYFTPPKPDFFQAGSYDLFLYLCTQALLISLTFSFVLMVNRHLQHDLKEDIQNRLKAEEIVKINLERLARAELASKTGNWELSVDTRQISYSVGAAKIYGLPSTFVENEHIRAIPLPEYRPRLDLALTDLIEKGHPYDIEYMIRTDDSGELKEIHSTAELSQDKSIVFGVIRDITERKNIEHKLEYLVQVDPLTGVFSRRHFMTMTERELANAARHSTPLSVLMLDIDNFKQVNDTYGHQIGDLVLQQFGKLFHGLLREVDIVGRYGGEEFAVALPQTDLVQAFEVSERIRRVIEQNEIPLKHGLPLKISVSIGVSAFKNAAENIDALLGRADQALYDAKHLGRNQVRIYETRVED
jgi:diguanylate cyclase (GGDEF)-like protein/PAS domain S-box-containing protein